MKKFIQEFKDFAFKGNVFDMAIGVIIGGAFGKIVTSLVNDIIMPLISKILGTTDFSSLSIVLGQNEEGPILLTYGNFIQTTIDFILIAFCIFVAVKLISKAKRKQEEIVEAVKVEENTLLLREIRDCLKEKGN